MEKDEDLTPRVSPGDEETDVNTTLTQEIADGSDSGVEVAPAQSCGSSLVSCYSEHDVDRGSDCGSSESMTRKQDDLVSDCSSVVFSDCLSHVSKTSTNSSTSGRSRRKQSETCSESSEVGDRRNMREVKLKKIESVRLKEKANARSVSAVRTEQKKRTVPAVNDGRWPSSAQKTARSRGTSVVDTGRVRKTSATMTSSTISTNSVMTTSASSASISQKTENKSTIEKYATLPRRPKKNDLLTVAKNNPPMSRDASLNRSDTLRRQQSKDSPTSNSVKNVLSPKTKKCVNKIVIYHETAVQTVLTNEDVTKALAGKTVSDCVEAPEKLDKCVQSEGPDKIQKLEELKCQLEQELESRAKEVKLLREEREDHHKRILRMLGQDVVELDPRTAVDELEKHLQLVGVTVIKQHEELNELRHFKLIAQRDLEKSFAAQKNLLQQQQEIEAEYGEIQEFLQAEKMALSDALKDTEQEVLNQKKECETKNTELEQQKSECQHLVRICEQRRQEILSLEAKLSGLDQKCRELLLQQGAAVSGAALALSGLGARLDNLVEQLVVSYNISEKDLEEAVFHNEAYSNSNSSPDESPSELITDVQHFNSSPKRCVSFLSAVIGAIKNATHNVGSRSPPSLTQADQSSESLGLLDSELEPSCLTLDTALEEQAGCESGGSKLYHSDSLQNLSNAILARQESERTGSPLANVPVQVNSLVDHVIDVDNLLTRLLKVLGIVQLNNVKELNQHSIELSGRLAEEEILRKKNEENMDKLLQELNEARTQLNDRVSKLEDTKRILTDNWRLATTQAQRQYQAIDSALESLQTIQEIVDQCPQLTKIQQDLEESNFRVAAGVDDVNANNGTNINNRLVKEKTNTNTVTNGVL